MANRYGWTVTASYQTSDAQLCVDIFERDDHTFGFEQFRHDPEDAGAWTRISYFGEQRFDSPDAAITAARNSLAWFDELSTD